MYRVHTGYLSGVNTGQDLFGVIRTGYRRDAVDPASLTLRRCRMASVRYFAPCFALQGATAAGAAGAGIRSAVGRTAVGFGAGLRGGLN